MRCHVLAASVGTLLVFLAGCGGGAGPPAATPSDVPLPAPPPVAPAPPPAPPPLPPASPEQLAREALKAPTSEEQEVAAVRLAEFGKPADEHLRRVLSESRSPAVRAACIRALAVQWDYDSMPAFLDALDDESELVRDRADAAVERMMSVDFGYRPDDPSQERAAAVKRLREHWEQFRHSEILEGWKRRLEEAERQKQREPPEQIAPVRLPAGK